MTVTPNGDLYLCKTKLENDYKNQLTWDNINTQNAYFNGTVQNTFSEYTYMKKDSTVTVGANIDSIIDCNYLFYINNGFTNKIYYCFITKMEYINENTTRITFETDCFQTWYFELQYNRCFVEREHVNNDTIGLHTIPEGLETGEYICNSVNYDETLSGYNAHMSYIVGATTYPNVDEAKDSQCGSDIYNGIYSGVKYFRYDVSVALDYVLDLYAKGGKVDSITGIYMIPQWLAPLKDGATYREVATSTTPKQYQFNVNKLNVLNNYTPHNNKLKCFPYTYLLVSNNTGQTNILHFEKFSDNNCTFLVQGCLCPSGSVAIFPINYNGIPANYDEGIMLGKYPICNFTTDMYTNWLTQNSINILGNTFTTDDLNIASTIASSTIGALTSIGSGNPAGVGLSIGNGLLGISDAMISKKQHNMISPSVQGNLNAGDINNSAGRNSFYFYSMSIKQEYAKIIDKYFDMFGYKVNDVKIPNITGRRNWNYVKTIECNVDGDIPQTDLNIIKTMFNNGVTLWHNPANIYNYSLDNSII